MNIRSRAARERAAALSTNLVDTVVGYYGRSAVQTGRSSGTAVVSNARAAGSQQSGILVDEARRSSGSIAFFDRMWGGRRMNTDCVLSLRYGGSHHKHGGAACGDAMEIRHTYLSAARRRGRGRAFRYSMQFHLWSGRGWQASSSPAAATSAAPAAVRPASLQVSPAEQMSCDVSRSAISAGCFTVPWASCGAAAGVREQRRRGRKRVVGHREYMLRSAAPPSIP